MVVASSLLPRRLFAKIGELRLQIDDLLAGAGTRGPHQPCAASGAASVPSRGSAPPLPVGEFDICICELNEADLLRSRDLVDVVAPALRPGGVLFLFYWNSAMGPFDLAQKLVDSDALAFDFPSRLYFTRTAERADSIRRWDSGFAGLASTDLTTRLRGAGAIARAMRAAVGNNRKSAMVADAMPEACTSVTIALEITG